MDGDHRERRGESHAKLRAKKQIRGFPDSRKKTKNGQSTCNKRDGCLKKTNVKKNP